MERASAQGLGNPAAPLFPTRSGTFPEKELVVDTIRAAAVALGLPLVTASGAPAWGSFVSAWRHPIPRGLRRHRRTLLASCWRLNREI